MVWDGIVSLCSKTYICFGKNADVTNKEIKASSKGLNKNLNKFNKDVFLNVLTTKRPGSGINRGFKATGKGIAHMNKRDLPFLIYISSEKFTVMVYTHLRWIFKANSHHEFPRNSATSK